MMNALAAWVVGFKGDFGFDSIGDSYTDNNVSGQWGNYVLCTDRQVPYVGMRGFCALMGAITIPVVYATMRESGYPIAIAVFSASLILFGESAGIPF
jgi:dolichyl-phosphate-mannose-protein mannosyltransferase